jgi:D-sedoheptulose 7-phosphate isomerase
VTMSDIQAIAHYQKEYFSIIRDAEFTAEGCPLKKEAWLSRVLAGLEKTKGNRGQLFFLGNGASCSMASHFATDFTKNLGIRAYSLSEGSLLTCFSNDYCYEDAYREMLRLYMNDGDMLIAISSSGRSLNIIQAAQFVRQQLPESLVITLSAFSRDNPLRGMGHVNLYLDCSEYGRVESGHAYYLHLMADFFQHRCGKSC